MSRTVAVVTVYFPEIDNAIKIAKIAEQVDSIVICDNSSNNNVDLFKDIINKKYFYWGKNLGLSKAFNKVLLNQDLGWCDDDTVIFFDQDTEIPENHIINLLNDYDDLNKLGYKVGCIGAAYFDKTSERMHNPQIIKKINKNLVLVKQILTSSMMTKYGTLKQVGFWNEEIFLDYADYDVAWRFEYNGFVCVMSYNSLMIHSLGIDVKKTIIKTSIVDKPFRGYYGIRDHFYLVHKKYVPLKFKIKLLKKITFSVVYKLLFYDDGIRRVKYMYYGFKDYLNNVHGEVKYKF